MICVKNHFRLLISITASGYSQSTVSPRLIKAAWTKQMCQVTDKSPIWILTFMSKIVTSRQSTVVRISGETQSNWSTNKTPSLVQDSATYVSSCSWDCKNIKIFVTVATRVGSRALAIFFRGHVGTFPWSCVPYLKFIWLKTRTLSLAILELLAFVAQKC